jgi:hypothetical protein
LPLLFGAKEVMDNGGEVLMAAILKAFYRKGIIEGMREMMNLE